MRRRSQLTKLEWTARGVWTEGQMAYFDVRVFNPIAKTYLGLDLSSSYRRNEKEKKRAYNHQVQLVDQGTFTPLVFSCLGGCGKEGSAFFKRLALKLSELRNCDFAKVMSYVRTCLNFSLIRSCLLCIRGSRSAKVEYNQRYRSSLGHC